MLGVGWESIDQFVTGFDGRGFLTDHQGSQTASLKMEFPEARPVYVWVRSLRRVLDDFPGFLGVDSESDVFSQAGSVPLNEWTWERTGPFLPAAEYAELRIDRPYPQTQAGYMALFIDTLLVTASDSFDPTSDPIWEPAIEMGIPMQERATEGDFLLTTGVGRYLCWVSAFDGTSLVDHRGNIGLRSNPVEVISLPAP